MRRASQHRALADCCAILRDEGATEALSLVFNQHSDQPYVREAASAALMQLEIYSNPEAKETSR